jgi:hypothetical protein
LQDVVYHALGSGVVAGLLRLDRDAAVREAGSVRKGVVPPLKCFSQALSVIPRLTHLEVTKRLDPDSDGKVLAGDVGSEREC